MGKMADANKQDWKTEFNMAVADMEEIHELRKKINFVAPQVRSGNLDYVDIYYSHLKQFYFNMARFLQKNHKKQLNNRFTYVEAELNDGKKYEIINNLDVLFVELDTVRQKLGLGIPVSRQQEGILKAVKNELK